MKDNDKYICSKCRNEIDRDDAERVGLVFYCSGCIKLHFDDGDDDVDLQTLVGNAGASC